MIRLALYLPSLGLFGLGNSYFDVPVGGYLLIAVGGTCLGVAVMLHLGKGA